MLDNLVEAGALEPGTTFTIPLDYVVNPEPALRIRIEVAEKSARLAIIIDRVAAGLVVMAVYTLVQWLIGG